MRGEAAACPGSITSNPMMPRSGSTLETTKFYIWQDHVLIQLITNLYIPLLPFLVYYLKNRNLPELDQRQWKIAVRASQACSMKTAHEGEFTYIGSSRYGGYLFFVPPMLEFLIFLILMPPLSLLKHKIHTAMPRTRSGRRCGLMQSTFLSIKRAVCSRGMCHW